MIFADFIKAIAQLSDGKFQRVLWLGIGLTIALLAGITIVFSTIVGWFVPDSFSLPWIGEITWVDNALSFAIVGVMMLASIFLMMPVASAFTGFFLDEVAQAVEDRHYPGLPPAQQISLAENLRDSANFMGVVVLANAVAMVLYLFIGPFAPLLFWAVNGYLLGREYFQMAAMRRIGREAATELRQNNRFKVWRAGVLMAIPLTIPIINLLIPILGAATFTHQFHRLNTPQK